MRFFTVVLAALTLSMAPQGTEAADGTIILAQSQAINDQARVVMTKEDREMLAHTFHRITFTAEAVDAVDARISDPETISLITMIEMDAQVMQRDLRVLMRSKSISMPILEESFREGLVHIAESKASDAYATYHRRQLDVSIELLELLSDTSQGAGDADVRAFSVKWLPAVKHHIQVLQQYNSVH